MSWYDKIMKITETLKPMKCKYYYPEIKIYSYGDGPQKLGFKEMYTCLWCHEALSGSNQETADMKFIKDFCDLSIKHNISFLEIKSLMDVIDAEKLKELENKA